MLHLAPELVDMALGRAARARSSWRRTSYVRFGGRVSFGWLSNDFFADGYIGDPTAATRRARQAAVRGRGARLRRGAARGRRVRLRPLSAERRTQRAARRRRPAVGADRGARRDRRGARPERRARLRTARAHRRRPRRARPRRRVDARPRARRARSTRSATSSPPAPAPTRTPAPVMTGSHIDTVRTGGRFDGNLGVLAGLEVIETLEQHGIATRPPDRASAFFTDEEGARFAPDMLGSLVYVGGMAVEEALDVARGRRRRPPRRRAGADRLRRPDAVPGRGRRRTRSSSCTSSRVRCSRTRASTIGVVTGVQGISWTELTITGQSAHAGTTPMRLRHDPGFVAAADHHRRARARRARSAGRRWPPSGAASSRPTWSTSSRRRSTITVDLRNTDERRAAPTPRRGSRRCATSSPRRRA